MNIGDGKKKLIGYFLKCIFTGPLQLVIVSQGRPVDHGNLSPGLR